MAMSNVLQEVIASSLAGLNFKRKSGSWYLINEEVFLMVNLQKSQYGRQYYVNFSVAFKAASKDDMPKAHQGDITFRLESIVPQEILARCKALLDLENSAVSDEERRTELKDLFVNYGLALLMQCGSISTTAEALHNGQLPEWTIAKTAKVLLKSVN